MSGHPSYSEQPYTKIGQLQPDMHGVNVAAIVIDKGADGEMKILESQTVDFGKFRMNNF